MKFSIYINQPMTVGLDLSVKEAVVFGAIYDSHSWAEKVVVNGDVWVWLSKSVLLTELPIVGTWESFKKIKQKLKEKGLIEYSVFGQKQVFKLTKLGQKWNESDRGKILPQGEKQTPTQGEDFTPNPLTNDHLSVNKKTKAKKESSPSRRKPKFEAPSFEQVHAYALERGRQDLAKKFFDYYETGSWKDAGGKAVRNWKQKFITWENNNPVQQQQGVNHGNGNGNQQFGGFRETESQRARRLNAELSQKARENGFNGSRSRPDHF